MTDQNSQSANEQRIGDFKSKLELLMDRVRANQEDSRWLVKEVEESLSEFMDTDFPMAMLPCEIERIKEIHQENQRLKHQMKLYEKVLEAALGQIKSLSNSCENFIEEAKDFIEEAKCFEQLFSTDEAEYDGEPMQLDEAQRLKNLAGQSLGGALEKMVQTRFGTTI